MPDYCMHSKHGLLVGMLDGDLLSLDRCLEENLGWNQGCNLLSSRHPVASFAVPHSASSAGSCSSSNFPSLRKRCVHITNVHYGPLCACAAHEPCFCTRKTASLSHDQVLSWSPAAILVTFFSFLRCSEHSPPLNPMQNANLCRVACIGGADTSTGSCPCHVVFLTCLFLLCLVFYLQKQADHWFLHGFGTDTELERS